MGREYPKAFKRWAAALAIPLLTGCHVVTPRFSASFCYDERAGKPDISSMSIVAGGITAGMGAEAVTVGMVTVPQATASLISAPARAVDNLTTNTR